jgi:nucleoside 2-deoxyribosyltransferase
VVTPVPYEVFTDRGISFTPTNLIDSSKMTLNALIDEFNRDVPGFGDEPRFFVGTTEIDPTALVPGQPYSIYPKTIKRPTENLAQLGGPAQPPRIEGPLIDIQWKVTDISGQQLCLPGNSKVPEEISLLQLFKIFILPKYRIPGIQIMWGNHYRGGNILEINKVTTLEDGDLVEIIVDQGKAPQATQVEVEYMIGSEKHTIYVNRSTTIEQLTQRLNFEHKGKGVHAIASEGLVIAPEDSVEDWIQRTAGIPLTAVLAQTVQVVVDFRGVEKYFTVQDTASEEDFKALVRHFLGLG